jgi:phosphatidylglycerol:prolipoprotein diacylglycerol transferase
MPEWTSGSRGDVGLCNDSWLYLDAHSGDHEGSRSMYPVLWQIGSFQLASWHLAYVVAAFVCWWLFHRNREKVLPELSAARLDLLFALAYVAAFLGARGLSIYLEQPEGAREWAGMIQLGSMTLYGGILGGATLVLILVGIWQLPVRGVSDLLLPPLLLGIGIGRIGCFLNGDDYDGLYRYPIQLVETGATWILALLVITMGRTRARGFQGDICIYGYASIRFILEWGRGDERGILFSPLLSPAQWISLFIVIVWSLYRWRSS